MCIYFTMVAFFEKSSTQSNWSVFFIYSKHESVQAYTTYSPQLVVKFGETAKIDFDSKWNSSHEFVANHQVEKRSL